MNLVADISAYGIQIVTDSDLFRKKTPDNSGVIKPISQTHGGLETEVRSDTLWWMCFERE